jgi:hypothetical protein
VVGDGYSGGPAKRGDRHGAAGLKTLLRCCVRACVEPAAGLCCAFMHLCCLFCVQAIEGQTITGPEPYSSQFCCLCQQPLLRRLKSRTQMCATHGLVARDIVRGLRCLPVVFMRQCDSCPNVFMQNSAVNIRRLFFAAVFPATDKGAAAYMAPGANQPFVQAQRAAEAVNARVFQAKWVKLTKAGRKAEEERFKAGGFIVLPEKRIRRGKACLLGCFCTVTLYTWVSFCCVAGEKRSACRCCSCWHGKHSCLSCYMFTCTCMFIRVRVAGCVACGRLPVHSDQRCWRSAVTLAVTHPAGALVASARAEFQCIVHKHASWCFLMRVALLVAAGGRRPCGGSTGGSATREEW